MTASSAPPAPTGAPTRPHRSQLLLYGLTLVAFLAASAVPTPLYRLYQERWDFSSAVLTSIFAAYFGTLLASFLVVGSLSDHVGRKPVILSALAVQIVSMLIFIEASGTAWLIAARLVQGVATGAALGALSAGLIDADQVRGQVFNSLAPLSGLAVGALGCSALVDFAPDPLHLPFYALLAVFVLQALLIWRSPERGARTPGALASLRPRIHVPPRSRRHLLLAMPINIAGWALAGFYFSLLPSVVRVVTGSTYALTSGVIIGALTGAGVVGTILARPHTARRLVLAAAALLSIGTMVSLLGVMRVSVALMLVGACLAGAGFGAGFLGALKTSMADVAAKDRGSMMSAILFISYVAFSAPALAAGIAIRSFGLVPTVIVYGSCTTLLSIAALASVLPRLQSARGR